MHLGLDHVLLAVSPDEMLPLLDDWRWLVNTDFEPYLVTAMGDMILRHRDGRVFLLDSGACRIEAIAVSMSVFEQEVGHTENAKCWLATDLLGDLLESGVELSEGQCFGYRLPPIVGGTREIDNFEPTDLVIHFSICGQIGEKTQGLPNGTRIRAFIHDQDQDKDAG